MKQQSTSPASSKPASRGSGEPSGAAEPDMGVAFPLSLQLRTDAPPLCPPPRATSRWGRFRAGAAAAPVHRRPRNGLTVPDVPTVWTQGHALDTLVAACYSFRSGKGDYVQERPRLDDARGRPVPIDDWEGLISLLPELGAVGALR